MSFIMAAGEIVDLFGKVGEGAESASECMSNCCKGPNSCSRVSSSFVDWIRGTAVAIGILEAG